MEARDGGTGDDGLRDGWEIHDAEQRRYVDRLPFLERLRWLEEAHELALALLGPEGFERARALRLSGS